MPETKIPQRVFVYNHLKTHGYITDVVAQNYGIRRLAARIEELKRNGVSIGVDIRRDDKGTRYAYYTLGCPDRNCELCEASALAVPRAA